MIKDFDLLQRANNDYTTIDLEHAEELAYRELIDSIRYIPLGDECGVMGNIANIITYKGRFYIQEEQFDRVFIYDDTGRCLKKIDKAKTGIFAAGVLFGTAGIKVLSSKDAKKLYTNCTAAVLRAKECVMKTATTIQENAEDIYAEAQQINEDRAAKAAQEFDGEVEAEAAETAADAE